MTSAPTLGLRISQWHKWQTSIIRTVVKRRIDSKIPLGEPYSMGKVVIAVDLDHHFLAFQALCGEPNADGLWARVLRYCAAKGALSGEILVQKEHFGRCVLSTTWDDVSPQRGERVFDSLLESGLASKLHVSDVGKGMKLARNLAGSAQVPSKNRAKSTQSLREARAPDSGSGSGSGSARTPNPLGKGDRLPSDSSPEPDPKPARDPAKFDGLDAETKRRACIDWAAKEASKSRDVGTWRAPAPSIRADLRDRRPYPDARVDKDFAEIRGKDWRGLSAVVRRLIRESRNGESA